MSSAHTAASGNDPKSANGPKNESFPKESFVKMDDIQYKLYLSAHESWVSKVAKLKKEFHEEALVRRFFEGFTEVPSLEEVPARAPTKTSKLPGYIDGSGQSLNMKVTLKSKARVDHKPTLSTKPHEAEKRDKKKQLRDARAKAQAEATGPD